MRRGTSHRADDAPVLDGDEADVPRRRGLRGYWSRLSPDMRVFTALMVAVLFLTAASGIRSEVLANASERRDAQEAIERDRLAAEQRKCLAAQVQAIGDYLNARSPLAQKTNDAFALAINSFAVAATTGNQDPTPIIKALTRSKKLLDEVDKERDDTQLPTFPAGECLSDPANPDGDDPDIEVPPAVDGTDDPPSSTPQSSNGTGQSGGQNQTGNRNGGGGSGGGGSPDNGDGFDGGGGPVPAPPADDDPPLIDVGITIPNILSLRLQPGSPPEAKILEKDHAAE